MRAKFEAWPRQKGDEFLEFVKRCFAQKRKNLLNNLGGMYLRTRLVEAFEAAGKAATLRAEELSLEDFAAVFESLEGKNAE
jgi:16S rRNA A1518/A1519 N6-dimethyltransferase RsmA/KsgA/DIM1 with predicted DNA glycosylase/AP lyase activity